SSRPPDNRSSVAACSASSTGLCHGSTKTAVPRRRVVVRAPSQVSRLRLAETWPKPVKWCSTTKVLWKPSASASTLFSIHSRKPWLLSVSSVPGCGRRACALPNSPNRIALSSRAAAAPLLDGFLELPEYRVAAGGRVVERGFGLGLAGKGRFQLLGDRIADLHEGAEPPALPSRHSAFGVVAPPAVVDALLLDCLGQRGDVLGHCGGIEHQLRIGSVETVGLGR